MKMKHTLHALVTLLILFVAGTGCIHYQEGQDPVLIEAEQLASNAELTIDKFLLFEQENRALINNNDVFLAAEYVRHNAPDWLLTLRQVTEDYRKSRTVENKDKLLSYVSFIRRTLVSINEKYNPPPETK